MKEKQLSELPISDLERLKQVEELRGLRWERANKWTSHITLLLAVVGTFWSAYTYLDQARQTHEDQRRQVLSGLMEQFSQDDPKKRVSAAESMMAFLEREDRALQVWRFAANQFRVETDSSVLQVLQELLQAAYDHYPSPDMIHYLEAIHDGVEREIQTLRGRLLPADAGTGASESSPSPAALTERQIALVYLSVTLARLNRTPIHLERAYLANVTLPPFDYSGARFQRAVLNGANLNGGVFDRVDFSGADLTGARLIGSRLESANFLGANLTQAQFDGAELSYADFTHATLIGTRFVGAKMYQAVLNWVGFPSELESAAPDFSGADMGHITMFHAHLHRAVFEGTDLHDADIVRSDLTGAIFTEANLSRSVLAESNFSNARLEGTFFWGADVTGSALDREGIDPSRKLGLRADSEASPRSPISPASEPSLRNATHRESDQSRTLSLRLASIKGPATEVLETLVARYHTKQDRVRIHLKSFTFPEQLNWRLRRPDHGFHLVLIDDVWLPYHVAQGHLQNVSALIHERGIAGRLGTDRELGRDFLPELLDLCRWPERDGSLFALPLTGDVMVLFTRKTTQTPVTLEQHLNHMRTDKPRELGTYGYGAHFSHGSPMVDHFLTLLWCQDGPLVRGRAEHPLNFFTVKALEALKTQVFLQDRAPLLTGLNTETQLGCGLVNHRFEAVVHWASLWRSMVAQCGLNGQELVQEIDIGLISGASTTSLIASSLLALPQQGELDQREAAFDFLIWATGPEGMTLSVEQGMLPTRTSILETGDSLADQPHFAIWREALQNAKPRPRHARWQDLSRIIETHLLRAMHHERPPWQQLEELQRRVNRELSPGPKRGEGQEENSLD
ncbi:Pentapeptide repeat-containing protein [Sulfidibacter corallicola]|uniref:Pentapeptide repeat-containing protein n=1 Tax=Sulfidibacter corallicola TaxID=2818388 RepID=A0A8A4U145_SULCO|nr:pentapeptide repeat-containing protein [Sulfidibacter corallicola]QTD52465.1 pentapeptide repeat-containing protein [Sulfidibacter corallicola]